MLMVPWVMFSFLRTKKNCSRVLEAEKMNRVISAAAAVIAACILFSGCSTEKQNGFRLRETPQTYVLQGGDSMVIMPTVTLYENGSAWLSQPLISSYGLFEIGRYEVKGNELTITHNVSHGGARSAAFEISDGGDTLTLLSSNLNYTKAGAVYKYRPNAEYLRSLTKVGGKKLTLESLRELAERAPNLEVSDFKPFEHYEIDPDYHLFDIEGEYTLTVILDAHGSTGCTVERNSTGESFPLHLNGSTGYVLDAFLGLASIPEFETRKWLDYFGTDEMPWNKSKELTLPEFPGVTFTWTYDKVTAGAEELFRGMPIWNVYLSDLTNDGKPEFCATVSFGSGIVDTRVLVFDYMTGKEYQLSDRMVTDYYLSMENGKLMVTQTDYLDGKPLIKGELRLVHGDIFRYGTQ
jgi:hypothetical protein